MELSVFFFRHLLADLGERVLEALAGGLAIHLGELAEPDRGFLAGFGIFIADAGGVFEQDIAGGGGFTAADQFFDILLDVARRDTPGFGGHEDGTFAGIGDGGPELAVEDVGVRFDGNSGVGHFFFARAKELSKRFELVAHAVEHLADGIDADFAALEAIESETYGEIFGEAEERGLVHFRRGRLRGDANKGLAQGDLRICRERGHTTLPFGLVELRILAGLGLAELHEKPEQALEVSLFELGDARGATGHIASAETWACTRPGSAHGPAAWACGSAARARAEA